MVTVPPVSGVWIASVWAATTLYEKRTLETLCVICASALAVRSPLKAVPVFCTYPSLTTLMSLLPAPSLARRTAQ